MDTVFRMKMNCLENHVSNIQLVLKTLRGEDKISQLTFDILTSELASIKNSIPKTSDYFELILSQAEEIPNPFSKNHQIETVKHINLAYDKFTNYDIFFKKEII